MEKLNTVVSDCCDLDVPERLAAAYRSRDAVLGQIENLARFHSATTHGCLCGKRSRETLAVIDADWINDRIVAMHRHGVG